ncbi:MAG: T9SS type A sorting domain-containing protein [Bacteroidales bacterium]|nr:T9SS type A sorting domain-containing protein [Bacteroidales bacterium]
MKNNFLFLFFAILWSLGMEAQPPAPASPIPQHEATDVSVSPVLSWSVVNWNPTCRYDVYLGLSPSPPLKFENLKDPQVLVTGLLADVKYYWYVIVYDSGYRQAFSPLWSFTTRKNPVLPLINHEYTYYPNESILTYNVVGNLDAGENGPNAIWDFSNLTVASNYQEIKYLNPSATPFVGGFPMSNVALKDELNQYHYFRYSNDGIQKLGIGTGVSSTIYTNPETIITYPFIYDSEFNDTYTGIGGNTNRSGVSYGTADAYGTLLLPGGNVLRDILRVKTESAYFDYYEGLVKGTSITSYTWYQSGSKEPVFKFEITTLSQNGTPYLNTKKAWMTKTATSSPNDLELNNKTSILNPVKDKIQILGLENYEQYRFFIYSMNAILVNSGQASPRIDVSEISSGMYIIELRNKKNEVIFRSKFIIQ